MVELTATTTKIHKQFPETIKYLNAFAFYFYFSTIQCIYETISSRKKLYHLNVSQTEWTILYIFFFHYEGEQKDFQKQFTENKRKKLQKYKWV